MKIKLFFTLLLGMGIFVFTSCSEVTSGEVCNDPNISCGSAVIESCCTNTECYWVYNGTKYTCSGTDCDAVYDIIIGKCTSSIANIDINETDLQLIKAKLQELNKELLIQARAASGCEY